MRKTVEMQKSTYLRFRFRNTTEFLHPNELEAPLATRSIIKMLNNLGAWPITLEHSTGRQWNTNTRIIDPEIIDHDEHDLKSFQTSDAFRVLRRK